jgi:hypothetical protein
MKTNGSYVEKKNLASNRLIRFLNNVFRNYDGTFSTKQIKREFGEVAGGYNGILAKHGYTVKTGYGMHKVLTQIPSNIAITSKEFPIAVINDGFKNEKI